MRFVYISDMHFKGGYSNEFERKLLEKIITEFEPDTILSGGDWDVIPFSKEELYEILGDVPLYSVFGNHDDPNVLKYYGILLDGVVKIGDIVVCGMGGAVTSDTMSYPETWFTPNEYIQKYFEILENLKEELLPCHILILHDPPKSLVDFEMQNNIYSIDYKSYRIIFDTFIHLLRPEVCLCGHVHSTPYTFYTIKLYDICVSDHPFEVPVLKVLTSSQFNYTFSVIDIDLNENYILIDVYSLLHGEFTKHFSYQKELNWLKPIV